MNIKDALEYNNIDYVSIDKYIILIPLFKMGLCSDDI